MNVDALHRAACERGEPTYPDPATGCAVYTAAALAARGTCCGSGCRHCPYEHMNVPRERRHALARARGEARRVD